MLSLSHGKKHQWPIHSIHDSVVVRGWGSNLPGSSLPTWHLSSCAARCRDFWWVRTACLHHVTGTAPRQPTCARHMTAVTSSTGVRRVITTARWSVCSSIDYNSEATMIKILHRVCWWRQWPKRHLQRIEDDAHSPNVTLLAVRLVVDNFWGWAQKNKNVPGYVLVLLLELQNVFHHRFLYLSPTFPPLLLLTHVHGSAAKIHEQVLDSDTALHDW